MKDFFNWHKKKTDIDSVPTRPYFHEREVWYARLGLNIGYEQDGKGVDYLRPILIFKKFNNDVCWVIPLTHTQKNTIYYAHITVLTKPSTAILSQLRLIDVKRLSHCVGKISDEDYKLVAKKLKELIP